MRCFVKLRLFSIHLPVQPFTARTRYYSQEVLVAALFFSEAGGPSEPCRGCFVQLCHCCLRRRVPSSLRVLGDRHSSRGMPSADHDMCLMMAVHDGCVRRATAALAAGANVNGRPGEKSAPIVLATAVDRPAMILFLVRHGADPDGRIFEPLQHPHPTEDMSVGMPGERALHVAAKSGNVELVRLLLKQARADPNAADNEGCTPLNATCQCQHACVEAVVRLLLEAGADPTLARRDGYGPMHGVTVRGHEGLVDVLLSRQPSTLNHCSPDGASPLFVACGEGRERMVSLLLSRGATQWMLGDEKHMFPLLAAVHEGHMGVCLLYTSPSPRD